MTYPRLSFDIFDETLDGDDPFFIVATFLDYDAAVDFVYNGDHPNRHCFEIDRVELCHHGMSAWLCADPVSHYPRGYPFD